MKFTPEVTTEVNGETAVAAVAASTPVPDHNELFDTPRFQEQFERKRQFEDRCAPEEVERIAEWTRGAEYREKNFARESLTVNPAKACQPLGGVLAGLGFAGTLPFVHGSQGCSAYFRSHLTRHFKEPVPAVSSSMTEDAAVFGGLNNMVEALLNATTLYKPDMVAVCTSCMAEVIGDDLHAFVGTAREKGAIVGDVPVAYAHTPSFVGSHLVGYDNMLRAILECLTRDSVKARAKGQADGEPSGKLNIVPGFDTYTGNHRELARMLGLMGVDHTILGDHSAALDSPADGEYHMYPGGTPLAAVADAVDANATVFLQETATRRTAEMVSGNGARTRLFSPRRSGWVTPTGSLPRWRGCLGSRFQTRSPPRGGGWLTR